MNTTKSVYNKLFSEDKVELASERIELANINQLVALIDEGENKLKEFNSLFAQIDKLQPNIVKVGEEITKLQTKINGLESTFEKQFAELGLKFSEYPEYKKASDFMSRSRMVGSMTASVRQL